jgi:hypothetical protein
MKMLSFFNDKQFQYPQMYISYSKEMSATLSHQSQANPLIMLLQKARFSLKPKNLLSCFLMSVKSILNEQLIACFDESAWFASAKSALENLSAEDAVWKPTNEIHSVCEIISHLNFYNRKCLWRFNGEKLTKDLIEIAETYSNADWQNVLDEFNSIMYEWKDLLENADEANFAEGDSASMIAHFNIHNAYHIGQIVIVRKFRKNWNSGQGVS